ncbi:sigma 54-interacting transcriptional regulator [Desulfallas sp. Bu1-1]|uniref:sigma-54-dependent Fis family transcriptional regulator n=1 Tax=Desulfallas sp. Bu1-1 TaxID=2787620 RepID=UPI00189F898F|nr:sigma-54-dependent Fis family transcriptional regulator [Desulfallas sp. Bu1-1]MBF7083673.1 sigma 54-interacting transcriptional regulator [Desulfallas sp. Bu1-1]
MKKSIRLGVISPYPEFGRLARDICEELNVEINVEQAILSEGVEVAQKWEKDNKVDAIVARGPTAILVKRSVNVPVSTVDITNFDLLQALYKAHAMSNGPVALISYEQRPPKYDFKILKKILGKQFYVYLYRDNEDLGTQIDKACEQGMETIVATGSCIIKKLQARGINAVYVHSNYESIREAIKKAITMVELKRENERFTRKLETILQNIHDGVMAIDERNNIFYFNTVAERILGVSAGNVLNRTIDELAERNIFLSILQDGQKTNGEIVKIRKKELVVNRMPFQMGEGARCLVVTFQVATQIRQMEEKIRQKLHDKGLIARYHFRDIVGESEQIVNAINQARKYAQTDSTILLMGESGTGKELFAQSIHNESKHYCGPFVAVNCAALPENLLESELFGYEEGAFTGARRGGKMGLFELAHNGTIFLDEVGELSAPLQARLLRVIQQKEVMRIGGDKVIPVNVRVITATNRDLKAAVQKGEFREDLFYRLNVLPLKIPPLRKRQGDIPLLFNYFMNKGNFNRTNYPQALLKKLERYNWPGNVRELENFVERYKAIGEEDERGFTTLFWLIESLLTENELNKGEKITIRVGPFEEMENQILNQLAMMYACNKKELARKLGISRTTLWRKLKSSGQVWKN